MVYYYPVQDSKWPPSLVEQQVVSNTKDASCRMQLSRS